MAFGTLILCLSLPLSVGLFVVQQTEKKNAREKKQHHHLMMIVPASLTFRPSFFFFCACVYLPLEEGGRGNHTQGHVCPLVVPEMAEVGSLAGYSGVRSTLPVCTWMWY